MSRRPNRCASARLGNAYSRKPGFSVCWLDLSRPAGPGLELLRLPGVRRWDLA